MDTLKTWVVGADASTGFLRAVLEAGGEKGYTHAEIAASVVAEVVATAAPYSAALAMMVDQYLDGDAADVEEALRGECACGCGWCLAECVW